MEFAIGFGLGWFLSVPVYLYFKRQREYKDQCLSVVESFVEAHKTGARELGMSVDELLDKSPLSIRDAYFAGVKAIRKTKGKED